jgi:hypothetical protein
MMMEGAELSEMSLHLYQTVWCRSILEQFSVFNNTAVYSSTALEPIIFVASLVHEWYKPKIAPSLSITLRHVGGVEVQFHSFLTSALDGDEWPVSCYG